MYYADLHIHTTASDGVFTPSQVVLHAKEKGLSLMAVSDHDSIRGVEEARSAASQAGIGLIPAVEISTGAEGEIHVLGYGVRSDSRALNALFAEMAQEREARAAEIIRRLCRLGLKLTMEEIPAEQGAVKGRAQIARALLQKGYVSEMQEAFDRYIGVGCPAYVPWIERDTKEMIALLRSERAIPVLAHPGLIKTALSEMLSAIDVWKEAGLMGMEVYHPAHFPDQFAVWDNAARKRSLLVTGGSDFHQIGDRHADIGDMCRHWPSCRQDAEALLAQLSLLK